MRSGEMDAESLSGISLHLYEDEDGTCELTATFWYDGFAGSGSAWFDRLATDGLWFSGALSFAPSEAAMGEGVVKRLIAMRTLCRSPGIGAPQSIVPATALS